MRVLHVISSLGVGGAEMMLAKLLEATRAEHDARVVCLGGDGPIGKAIRALGVEVIALGLRPGVAAVRGLASLARAWRTYRPDVVQTWMYHADLAGAVSRCFATPSPLVWGIRCEGGASWRLKRSTRMVASACAALSRWAPALVVCCSASARDAHVRQGYDPSRMRVIPNGFHLTRRPPARHERDAARAALGIAAGSRVIGIVARFDPAKDFGTFARAAGLAARARPDVVFVLVGEGLVEGNAVLGTWLDQAGVLDRCLLLGYRPDVARVLAAFDLFTLASASEGSPNALGEAMAGGLPCVTTDAGGARTMLGEAGLVVPVRDPAALATAWIQVLAWPDDRLAAAGRAARERIAAHFAIDDVARQYLAVYEEAIRTSAWRGVPP